MATKDTKEAILKAAKKLFIEHGFAGTSMSQIAKLAKVNHSLMFHHFTNKQGLWSAVKLDIVEKAKQSKTILPSTDLPYENFITQLFENNIAFYQSEPELIRLFNWQRLENKKKTHKPLPISQELQSWITAFELYQKQGNIHKKVNIHFLINMMLSLTSSTALDPDFFSKTEAERHEYSQFCIQAILLNSMH